MGIINLNSWYIAYIDTFQDIYQYQLIILMQKYGLA